jgi:hypothetical protein
MNFLQIPNEILEEIICFCDRKSAYALLQVSIKFAKLVRNSKVWSSFKTKRHNIYKKNIKGFFQLFKIRLFSELPLTEYQKHHIKKLLKGKDHISFRTISKDSKYASDLFKLVNMVYQPSFIFTESFLIKLDKNFKISLVDASTREILLKFGHFRLINKKEIKIMFGPFSSITILIDEKYTNITGRMHYNYTLFNKDLILFKDPKELKDKLFHIQQDSTLFLFISILIWTLASQRETAKN